MIKQFASIIFFVGDGNKWQSSLTKRKETEEQESALRSPRF